MKLFKYLSVASVVQGGAMFAANEGERDCIRECKNARDCRGEAASDENDNPALCVLQCRDECLPRKDLLRSHFSLKRDSATLTKNTKSKLTEFLFEL